MKRHVALMMVAGILAGPIHSTGDEAISITVRPPSQRSKEVPELKVRGAQREESRAHLGGRRTELLPQQLNAARRRGFTAELLFHRARFTCRLV